MLLNKIKLDWTDTVLLQEHDETENISEDIKFTRKFDFLIYIDLSKWTANDKIADYFKTVTDTEESLSYLKKESSKCLFILDSWNEFAWKETEGQIAELSKGHIFKECTIIIASQFMQKKFLPYHKNKTCIIQGFTEEQAKNFVQKQFDEDKTLPSFETELITNPFMLHAACFLLKNEISVTVCLTRLFIEIVLIMIKNTKGEINATSILSLDACKKDLLSIGELALIGLTETEKTKTVFTEEEANEIETGLGTKGCDLGLLHKVAERSRQNPVQLTFPHELVQQFLAAIYAANEEKGFQMLDKYIEDLVIVYKFQKVITFISGLSNEKGSHFINKVILLSQNKPPYGAKCSKFCWAGWAASPDYIWVQHYTRKAENITPFILKCLWEMWKMSDSQEKLFPLSTDETALKQVSLQPDLNFEMIPLRNVNELVELGAVKFDKGNLMHLYNLNDDKSIKEDLTIPFKFLPEKTTDVFCLHNLKHKCRYDNLFNWLSNQKQLFKIYISDINMPLSETTVLKTIRMHLGENLKTLLLRDIDLTGAEKELCDTILELHSLYYFSLREAKMDKGFAANICEAFSQEEKSPKLKRLDLSGTDLSSANDKLGEALTFQCCLKELKLNNTNMTEAQTKQVCSVLAGNWSLISLGLSSNDHLTKAIECLTLKINQMVSLKDLNVSKGDINEPQMKDLFLKLPQSITALLMWESKAIRPTEEYVLGIENQIKELKNLEVVQINMSENLKRRLIKTNNNLEVCILFEGEFKKPKIARCLKKISVGYDRFTSYELRQNREATTTK